MTSLALMLTLSLLRVEATRVCDVSGADAACDLAVDCESTTDDDTLALVLVCDGSDGVDRDLEARP